MKRILAIITTLTISWTTFFIVGSEAFASGQLVETKPTPSYPDMSVYFVDSLFDKCFNGLEWYVESLKTTVSDFCIKYSVDSDTLYAIASYEGYPDVAGVTREDYKSTVDNFKSYWSSWNDFSSDYFHLSSAIENLREEHCLPPQLLDNESIIVDIPISEIIEFVFGNDNPGYKFNPDGTFAVPADEFVTAVNTNTTVLTTSLPTSSISWKNNPLAVSGYDGIRSEQHLAMMVAGNWFGQSKDVYAMPFVVKDGITYYGDSVYHFYYGDFTYNVNSGTDYIEHSVSNNPIIDKYSSLSSTSDAVKTFYLMKSGSVYTTLPWNETYLVPNVSGGFSSFLTGDKQFYLSGLNSRTNSTTLSHYFKSSDGTISSNVNQTLFNTFFNASNVGDSFTWSKLNQIPATDTFRSTTILDCMKATSASPYAVKNADGKFNLSVDDVPYDYGFLVCSNRFEIGTLSSYLDGSRIPSNSYVTISGDSVYDYSITNNDTGDTTNLGDFINHGYAWINTGSGTQNNQGSGNGSGGGTGGNVTVGGDVNVSGSIDVNVSGGLDINVNVNGGGSGNGGGNKGGNGNVNVNESDTNILNDNLNDATEKSIGIRNFLEEFFSFLPPELLSLLGILFTLVIIKVIFNRK